VSQSVVRVVAGLLAFAAVAAAGIAAVFGFEEGSAIDSWALVTLVALPAGLVAYGAVEYAQTRRLDSLSRQFDTRTLVLIPLAVALNVALGAAVGSVLRLPIYLDSIGTVLVAALAGPLAGAVTGLLSPLTWTYLAPPPFQSPTSAPFALTATVIGLLAGSFAHWGWFRPRPGSGSRSLVVAAAVVGTSIVALAVLALAGYRAIFGEESLLPGEGSDPVLAWLAVLGLALVAVALAGVVLLLVRQRDRTVAYVVLAGLITGIVAAAISAPIAANVYGGVTGSGTDFLVAALRAGGADLAAATLGQSLISDPIDKVITYLLVYLILGAMALRLTASFPQGERLVPAGDAGVLAAGRDADLPGAPSETGR
jgi:hypothetical protein